MININPKTILKFNPYKIFKIKNKNYLYIINTSGLYEIDNVFLDLLSQNDKSIDNVYNEMKSVYSKNEFFDLIKNLYNIDLLNIDENKNNYEEDNSPITALSLMIAQECNMRCKYCYGEDGEYNNKGVMSKEVAFRAIDYLVENTDKKELALAFIGGEPLISYKLITEIIDYCNMLKDKLGLEFSYTMTTNGILLNKEIEKFLIDNKIRTQISIDGTKEKNDINRILSNKRGAYDKVIEKTKSMRAKGILTARATLTNDNIDYIEVFEHLNGLGFRAIPIALAQNMIDDEVFEEALNSYREYIGYFEKLLINKEYILASKMTDIIKALEKIEFSSHREKGGGAVRSMYAVDIDGKLYPCHRFVGEEGFCLGDIYKGVDRKEFLEKLDLNHRPKCKDCWAKNLCLGGCPYENYKAGGNIDIESERNCKSMKMLFEELIKIYVNLTDVDKASLFFK